MTKAKGAYCKVAAGYKRKGVKRRTKCSGKRKDPCIRAKSCTWTGSYAKKRRSTKGRKKTSGRKKARSGAKKCVWGARTHRCHLAKR